VRFEIQDGLTVGLVLGMQERERFGFLLRAQADLFASEGVFVIGGDHSRRGMIRGWVSRLLSAGHAHQEAGCRITG
jgi:hypothetical protein